MKTTTPPPRRERPSAPQTYVTGQLRVTLEGAREPSPGEWLLGELAKANERYRAQLSAKKTESRRSWWRPF